MRQVKKLVGQNIISAIKSTFGRHRGQNELGPKASYSWGKGKYYLFTYKGVIQNGIFAHNGMPLYAYQICDFDNFLIKFYC